MKCPRCYQPVRVVFYDKKGDSRCEDCKRGEEEVLGASCAVFVDGIPGGMWLENGFKNPIKVYSYSEAHRLHKEAGLIEKEKFCPMPGTDIDPQGIPNPKGYMDKQTLENARVLLSRNGAKATEKEWDGVEAGVLRDIQVGVITERDAKAIVGGDTKRMSRFARRTEKP